MSIESEYEDGYCVLQSIPFDNYGRPVVDDSIVAIGRRFIFTRNNYSVTFSIFYTKAAAEGFDVESEDGEAETIKELFLIAKRRFDARESLVVEASGRHEVQ